MLTMALVGYEQEKTKIDEKIRSIKALIGGQKSAGTSNGTPEPAPSGGGAKRKRVLSAEARKRIAVAQRRRWAEHRKTLGQAE